MNTRTRAKLKMAQILGHSVENISDEAELTSLVNSSFVLVEMVIELQDEFDVRFHQADMNSVSTVGQLLDLIENRVSVSEL
jgi:acyl carrier protein